MHFLVEIALDMAMTPQITDERTKEGHSRPLLSADFHKYGGIRPADASRLAALLVG